MGNHHSTSHSVHRTRKNVHWKSAGRPAPPGKPDIIPVLGDDEPNAITLRWAPVSHDGGAPLRGYQVECNRLGSAEWVRTAPPVVLRPELILTGLDPPHRYQFRVAAINAVGRSEYSEFSDILNINNDRPLQQPPRFIQHLENVTALENDKTEFRVSFSGLPLPTIAWFKDDYEIFSSRRTAISSTESSSVLLFHQTLPSDEGEIKCTATNRAGHAVTKARLSLEAAPKLRYPRQYEDGLLYEINETVLLKITIVGKPTPDVEWRHDGKSIIIDDRVQITNTPKFSMLKIHTARRSDRGEYQIQAKNNIGEDTAAFLVTITAPPDPPRNVNVTRQVDKSVTLDWEPPEDDGGCRIGNYVVEYYRSGWNVWLKAVTSRKTNVTLFDLIEGSEYRFRVKAESPYGMSSPSTESVPVKIPGRSVDMEFLAVESRIINDVLQKEDGEEVPISPAPRRKRISVPVDNQMQTATTSPVPRKLPRLPSTEDSNSTEIMLVLYPENKNSVETTEKRKSFQLDLEDALTPPPISLSAPELSSRYIAPFKALRHAVSSTELLHERAMARFYKVVAMKEEQSKEKAVKVTESNHIPKNNVNDIVMQKKLNQSNDENKDNISTPEIEIDTINKSSESNIDSLVESRNMETKWQSISFDEDYTASTVSTDGEEYSDEDEGSLNEDVERGNNNLDEEETYNPRDKFTRPSSGKSIDDEENYLREELKPLPLPDPNFVPKPILKKRDTDKVVESYVSPIIPKKKEKVENGEKKGMKIFKKITRMPVQKPFSFPKILNKKETAKGENKMMNKAQKEVKKPEKSDDHVGDEGKTVIDYYGNIVKEYGSQRRPNTPLYLNTEDLKKVAEEQQANNTENQIKDKEIDNLNKTVPGKSLAKATTKPVVKRDKNKANSIPKPTKTLLNNPSKQVSKTEDSKSEKKEDHQLISIKTNDNPDNIQIVQETQVLLKTTERATIIIPIDYKKLEERAKVNVRTAIDYTVDICLLLLAFWVYLFKDERLAVPFLILIIYRQLQETIIISLPEWTSRYTPTWLKKKIS